MVTRWLRSTSNFYPLIGQNLTGEIMRKIYAPSENLFTGSWSWQSFVSSFCDVFKLFMAGLSIGFLFEKCAACQSHQKSYFIWRQFRFSPCWCVRGLLRLKEFWPYLMAFRSCISTCAPEYSHCKFGACEKWEPAGHINDFGNFLNGFANSPFLPCIPHRSRLFWLNSTDIVEFSSWKRFIMLSIL